MHLLARIKDARTEYTYTHVLDAYLCSYERWYAILIAERMRVCIFCLACIFCFACVWVLVFVLMLLYVTVCECKFVYICTYECVFMHRYIYERIYVYTYICVYMFMHTYICSWFYLFLVYLSVKSFLFGLCWLVFYPCRLLNKSYLILSYLILSYL